MDLEVLIRQTVRDVLREELRALAAELKPSPPAEFMTVAEAADAAKVSPDTVRRWVASGRLRAHHAGRELRVSHAALAEFMAGAAAAEKDAPLTPEAAVDLALARRRG